ncbi:MAG: hypothetical protein ACP6IP_02395 [Candidatus Njordarchaeia archaeon]
MSMCVRQVLETFIRNQRNKLYDWVANLKREAVINLETDKLTMITQFEGSLATLQPIISNYAKPEQYVQALKSHSLIMSFLIVMLEMSHSLDPMEILTRAQKMTSVLKSGSSLDLGGIISETRRNLNELGATGERIYLEGSRRYLSTIIESCGFGDLGKSELFLLRDAINAFLVLTEKPFISIEEIGVKMGINEKKAKEIIKNLAKDHPEIVNEGNLVTTLTKIEKWIEKEQEKFEDMESYALLKKHFPNLLEKVYAKRIQKTTKNVLEMLEEL